MLKKIVFWGLITLTSAFDLSAKIMTISDIKDAVDYVNLDKDTLVIFDINDVLIRPQDEVLRVIHKKVKAKLKKDTFNTLSNDEKNKLIHIMDYQPKYIVVDSEIPKWIKKMQSAKMHVMALSSYCAGGKNSPRGEDIMLVNLYQLGYNFNPMWSNVTMRLDESKYQPGIGSNDQSYPMIKDGVVFTCFQSKGDFLRLFLRIEEYKPTKIVFIDDKLSNIKSVEEFATSANIEFLGINYITESKVNHNTLDLAVAERQFEVLKTQKKWLSDKSIKMHLNNKK